MKWPVLIVARLLELRRAGERDFDRAWARALSELPAPERQGDGDPGLEPFGAFFRRVCEREWRGSATVDYAGLRELLPEVSETGVRRHGQPDRTGRNTLIA